MTSFTYIFRYSWRKPDTRGGRGGGGGGGGFTGWGGWRRGARGSGGASGGGCGGGRVSDRKSSHSPRSFLYIYLYSPCINATSEHMKLGG